MRSVSKAMLTAAFIIATLMVTSKNKTIMNNKTNHYVLVHGAWQAPYVWNELRSILESKGNKVTVVELPGHGADNSAAYTLSLDVYSNTVISAIHQSPGKVILVAHSMGGMVATQVAEKIPGRISKVIYVGAFLPANGQALTDLAFADPGSKLGASLLPSEDQLTLDVKKENLAALFIADGDEATQQVVLNNYRAEPAIPLASKVSTTKERFGSVEKVYIKTLQDRVISPAFQDKMIAAAGITAVYEINTSHSPFLSQPKELSGLLVKATD